jgi:hypothetical protein
MPDGFEDWSGRTFTDMNLSNTRWRETMLVNARFSGLIIGLVINDIEVAPLIDAEMTRRHPERAKLRPGSVAEVREAWAVIEEQWESTKARAASLSEAALQERVDDEWSCAETFRHLVFVTDMWISGNALGNPPNPHPWGMPPSFVRGMAGIDADASPTWAEVVPVREGRMAIVRELIDGLSDDGLQVKRGDHTVLGCLHTQLNEEWHHNWFANRDLDRLT